MRPPSPGCALQPRTRRRPRPRRSNSITVDSASVRMAAPQVTRVGQNGGSALSCSLTKPGQSTRPPASQKRRITSPRWSRFCPGMTSNVRNVPSPMTGKGWLVLGIVLAMIGGAEEGAAPACCAPTLVPISAPPGMAAAARPTPRGAPQKIPPADRPDLISSRVLHGRPSLSWMAPGSREVPTCLFPWRLTERMPRPSSPSPPRSRSPAAPAGRSAPGATGI